MDVRFIELQDKIINIYNNTKLPHEIKTKALYVEMAIHGRKSPIEVETLYQELQNEVVDYLNAKQGVKL